MRHRACFSRAHHIISRELCGNVMSTDGCGCLLSGLRFRELASGFAAGFSDAATARRTYSNDSDHDSCDCHTPANDSSS
jgi:hypothetical protein